MKKLVSLMLVLSTLVCSMAVFAETIAQDIVVQTVTGKVECEVSPAKWQAVTAGMKLAPSTVINTGLNSSLVLKVGDRVVTVKAMQKGTAEKLTSGVAAARTGIRLGATVTQSNVNSDSDEGRTNISTASTRASDATRDVEWSEE